MDARTKTVTDPFDYLVADHRIFHELFKQIDQTDDTYTREELFEEIKNALDFHSELEEATLYPTLEYVGTTRELAEEAEVEHKLVKNRLEELSGLAVLGDEWQAKFTVLKDMVERHIEEEEGNLFREARRSLSSQNIETLADEMNGYIEERT